MAEPSLLRLSRRASNTGELALSGILDRVMVSGLTARIASARHLPADLHIRCDGLSALEADGAARLWLLVHELESERGHRVRLLGLPERLAAQLGSHPLAAFVVTEEELFRDPFAGGDSSAR